MHADLGALFARAPLLSVLAGDDILDFGPTCPPHATGPLHGPPGLQDGDEG
jgi:hypothetical protein